MRVFISHNSEDKADQRLRLLESLLRERGFQPWKADQELQAGQNLQSALRDAIARCGACVFFLTEGSGSSPWCMAELGAFWGTGKPVWILRGKDAPSVDKVAPQFRELLYTDEPKQIAKAASSLYSRQPKTPGDARVAEVSIGDFINQLGIRLSSEIGPIIAGVSRISHQISVLLPFDQNTVFGMRYGHFFHEKNVLAEKFVEILEKQFLDQGKKVRLLMDAGTTIYPVFQQLAERKDDPKWTENVKIITNNIPGVLVLLRDARAGGGQLHAPLLFDISVVGGQPSADYWALLSNDPGTQIDKFIDADTTSAEVVTIGLTTGNYGRSDGMTLFVRGSQHMGFKKALVDRSQIVYSLMPLGKLLPKPAKEVNQHLIQEEVSEDPESRYKELRIDLATSRSLTTLTTGRKEGDKMYPHFVSVQNEFDRANAEAPAGTFVSEFVEFDVAKICKRDSSMEEELEMPHETHRPHLKVWFHWPE